VGAVEEAPVRPYVYTFSTMTLDGRLAPPGGRRYRLSCDDDFRLQHRLRSGADAVAVGAGTVEADDPRLTVRLEGAPSPARVVFDASLRVPPQARVFRGPGRRILVTSSGHPPERLEPFRRIGVELVEVPDADPRLAMVELRRRGIRRLMIEGGGRLIGSLLASGVVDEVRVTVAPQILGDGVPLAVIPGSGRARLALRRVSRLCGWWVHLEYSVLEPKWGVWG
jgi:2,5-diamino-6-hydroxy-4-(5-phosphoribosylamino)pyrimidine 1'-reductase